MESTPTAFAVLDILGYGRLMAKKPKEVLPLVHELLRSSIMNMNRPVQHDIDQFVRFSGANTRPEIEYLQFSDTLMIYLREDKSGPPQLSRPSQLVESVCYATSLVLAHFMASGIPLRGAVGFGQTFISPEPLFFTGVELYETFKLEREQVWAGAALHSSAKEALGEVRDSSFLTKYQVPMTKPSDVDPDLAIDWVSLLKCGDDIVPPWGKMFPEINPDITKKGKETLWFYTILESRSRPSSLGLAKETIESMRSRLLNLI